jgi:hypothetical protein
VNVDLSVLPFHVAGMGKVVQLDGWTGRPGNDGAQDPVDEVGLRRGPAPLNNDVLLVLLTDDESDLDALLEHREVPMEQPVYRGDIAAQLPLAIRQVTPVPRQRRSEAVGSIR